MDLSHSFINDYAFRLLRFNKITKSSEHIPDKSLGAATQTSY